MSGSDLSELPDDLAGRFRILDKLPSSLVASDAPEDTQTIEGELQIPLTSSLKISYRLDPSSVNTETQTEELRTGLALDGEELAFAATEPYEVLVSGPGVELSVSSTYDQDVAGARFEVEVTNRRQEALAGPVLVEIEAVSAGNFAGYRDASGNWQVRDGTILTWTLEEGLPPGETITRTAIGSLTRAEAESEVTWQVRVQRDRVDGGTQLLAQSESQTTVPETEATDGESVNFDAGQMVQLITFVVTMALIAIMIGAVIRRHRDREGLVGKEAEAQRQHEESIFRAYIEGILVLVILVAILVLALQRSLQAESAASLIGVIAGYALGQRRGR